VFMLVGLYQVGYREVVSMVCTKDGIGYGCRTENNTPEHTHSRNILLRLTGE